LPRDGDQVRETAERVARNSYGKLVAFLAARTRDVAAAEDALADVSPPPRRLDGKRNSPQPEAWLMAVARRKAIDAGRRRRSSENAVPIFR